MSSGRHLISRFSLSSWGVLLVLVLLWWRLIDHLRIEWSLNPQYAYGWAVPILCLLLGWRNHSHSGTSANLNAGANPLRIFALAGALLLYWPTRFIAEANPDWRLVSWTLALEVLAITWFWLPQLGVRRAVLNFPLAFFLIAVPWPTQVEQVFIQTLTRANAAVTIELLNFAGIPALARGNVIEISTGLVGIDEACSGIRSLQATLMLGLFFGAWYRLRPGARAGLVGIGFWLALLFNLARTLVLVTVAAKQGVPAIDRWHDPVGIGILLGCFGGVWWAALRLAPRSGARQAQPVSCESTTSRLEQLPLPAALGWLTMLCVLAAELACAGWYRHQERQLPPPVSWQPEVAALAARSLPIAERTRAILRYDTAQNLAWTQADGVRWQMIFLQWNAGRIAPHLARNHTPEVCLSAAGHTLKSVSDLILVPITADLTLPFRCYAFDHEGRSLFVFYCLREDRARDGGFATESLTPQSRLRAVREGRRNLGQRSLEIALWNVADEAAAEKLLREKLPQWLTR